MKSIRRTKFDNRFRFPEHWRTSCPFRIGSTPPAKVELEVGPEIHFEEGDLLVPPHFDEIEEE